MEHKYCAENETILIRPLKKSDIEHLRLWRNNPELSVYLSLIPYITPESQKRWFERYQQDTNILFFAVIVKERQKLIGSVALYGFLDDKCKVGRIVIGDPSSHGKGIGYEALLLAISVAIRKLGIKIIGLDVHEDNIPARKIYDKAGFKVITKHEFEKGGQELEMEITSRFFYEVNASAESIRVFQEKMSGK